MKRRTLLAAGAVLPLAPHLPPAPGPPDRTAAPKVRWWWPHGLVDPAEIAREVDQIADAGFGGVEIQDVHHSVRDDLDAEHHGWGSAPWLAAVRIALRRARARGLTVDLAVGPSWPAAVPSITPDDPAAACELAHDARTLTAGQVWDGAAGDRPLLVQAARLTGTATLDPASLHTPAPGWVVPDGAWVVIAYRERGSGQQPEAGPHTVPPAYVVDHFSRAGTAAVTDFWRRRLLTPAIRALLRDAGGDLFEDSLEIETEETIWTPGFLGEFRRRAGYPLEPYLPVIVQKSEDYQFSYDPVTTAGVRDDVQRVLSDLYHENHLLPLRDFAHGLGLGLRAQPYGLATDAIRSAGLLDVPEGESLGFKNLDDYRVLAAGRDMAGRRLLSCESAAYANGAYSTTWDKVLQTMGSAFAGGVNQAVLHGFSYATVPGARWPGFAAFSPYNGTGIGFAESWGPRQPTWRHVPDVTGWFTHTQRLLRTGTHRVDLAYFRQKGFTSTGLGAAWATNDGIPIGWTHGFLDEAALALPAARVRDRRLAPDGPAYRALIVDGDPFRGKEHTLSVRAARTIHALARAGLPVVMLGDWADARPTGLARPGATEELRTLLAALLALPSVRVAPDAAGIPVALAALGVTRDVEYERSTVMTVHRQDGDRDLYYVANARHAENRRITPVDLDVWLTARHRTAVPHVLDAWTGTTTRLAVFERSGTKIRARARLNPGQSMLVALEPAGRRVHATATDAESLRYEGRSLVLRATRAGAHTTTLSDGRIVATNVDDVPAPIPLTAWDLEVEDWQPSGVTTRTLSLPALAAWPSIPGLEDVSGVGRYRTTVDLPRGLRAYLEMGEVLDTCRVRVNGRALPPVDVQDPVLDAGPWLRTGRNTIEIEVATTLLNRLRTTDPAVFGIAARQQYGLAGPVRLVPYREVSLP